VGLVAIGRLEDGSDPALGVPGIGLIDGVFCEDENIRAFIRGSDGGAQSGYTPADNKYVSELLG